MSMLWLVACDGRQVTLDVVKLWYAKLINNDIDMYDPVSDTLANAVNTSISEDLGQVRAAAAVVVAAAAVVLGSLYSLMCL
jgi:hypothetical protein